MSHTELIAMDLDGTLLRADKTISPRTLAALDACRGRGIWLAFATARSEAACRRFADAVRPRLIVSCGGARAVRLGAEGFAEPTRLLYEARLPAPFADEIIAFCRGLPSVGRILAELADGQYLVSDAAPPPAGDYAHAVPFHFTRPLPGDAYKLVVQLDAADAARLRAAFPGANIYGYTGTRWQFIAAAGATKWRGLAAAMADAAIRPSRVIAFGDDVSDAEMLRSCGQGVAMENAVPQARQAAGALCGTNEADGLGIWLEENVLK